MFGIAGVKRLSLRRTACDLPSPPVGDTTRCSNIFSVMTKTAKRRAFVMVQKLNVPGYETPAGCGWAFLSNPEYRGWTGAGRRGLFAEIGGKPIEELTQSVKACWFLNHFLHA